jgi:hypothetical protein
MFQKCRIWEHDFELHINEFIKAQIFSINAPLCLLLIVVIAYISDSFKIFEVEIIINL